MSATTITVEDLIRLRHLARGLNLGGRRPVSSVIAGVHLSRFRGRGVDYLESRNYEFGDDIRDLDWRVTARTGKPHTKIFQEERERPVIVLLDLDAGMYFGTQRRLKAVMAAEIAALIGWAAVRRGDRIGGLVFHGESHHEVRPRGGRRGMMRFIRVVEREMSPDRPSTDLVGGGLPVALARLRKVTRPGSLVVLVSDFSNLDRDCDRHLSRMRQHNDLAAFQVLDPVERQVPPPGVYPISDGKGEAVLDLTSARMRSEYAEAVVDGYRAGLERLRGFGIPVVEAAPGDEPIEVVGRLFASRRAVA